MKKILVIVGSNKSIEQSNTANLAKELVQNIKVKGEVINAEFISLGEKNIQNCRGCLTCTKSGKCPINDDLEKVKNRMKEADLIILGSPVHISHVSSIYKNFLDRIFVSMHIFEFHGKPCINVITSNGSGEQETEKYMNHIALLLGMIKLGNLIRLDNEKFDQKKLDKLANKAGKILEDRSKLKPSFMNSLYFSSMKSIIKKNEAYFEYESRYWKEAGWLTKNFKQINQVV